MPKEFFTFISESESCFFYIYKGIKRYKKGKGIIAIWHEKIFTFISELCFGYKGPGCSQFVNGLVLFMEKIRLK